MELPLMKTFKELQNYITEAQGKPYVKPYTTLSGGQGWKASNGKKLKFFGPEFKKSALKHAGLQEDGAGGAAPGAGAPGGGTGAAPTNTTAGIKPSIDNPPMGKRKQKSYQQKNQEAEKEYVTTGLRKIMGGVNV
jgi:hypothetical protein